MKSDLFVQAAKIWKHVTTGQAKEILQLEIDAYRQLLSYFMVGDYYYYIFNLQRAEFDFVSEEMSRVLGYPLADITVPFIVEKIHPEDQPWFLNFENQVTIFFSRLTFDQIPNYKVCYDYRIRKSDGEYIRILQQVVTVTYSQDNSVIRTFGVHTDISHLKMHGLPSLSFIGLNGEPSYINVEIDKPFASTKSLLTKREFEVLKNIALGKSSEEISRKLFISKQTVDIHRKNLLRKTGSVNTAQLTYYAVSNGWI